LALVRQRGGDVVTRLHQLRKADFRRCHRAPQSRPPLSAPKLGRGMDVHYCLLLEATTRYRQF
jgi:hypothetical protein